MARPKKGAHVLKLTERTGRLKFASFTSDHATANDIAALRVAVEQRLRPQVGRHGGFVVHAKPGAPDWFIVFERTWPEADLDRDVRAIANEQGWVLFMEPGTPVSEMGINPADFLFNRDLRRDRPSN